MTASVVEFTTLAEVLSERLLRASLVFALGVLVVVVLVLARSARRLSLSALSAWRLEAII